MFSLLVFEGAEVIGEYRVSLPDDSDSAIKEIFAKLKPEMSGVLLCDFGVIAHSANLPKENVWYRPVIMHV